MLFDETDDYATDATPLETLDDYAMASAWAMGDEGDDDETRAILAGFARLAADDE